MKKILTCLAIAIFAQPASEVLAQRTVQLPIVPRVELVHRDHYQLSYRFSGGGFGDWLIVGAQPLQSRERFRPV